jgi:hypothetical protein
MTGDLSNTPAVLTTERMNPELKAKWLESLRSGKYAQGTNQLRCNDEFCCLGVLCDIVDPNAWDESEEWVYGTGEDQESEIGVLPHRFRDFVALIPGAVESQLIQMNDAGITFSNIADYIEANL